MVPAHLAYLADAVALNGPHYASYTPAQRTKFHASELEKAARWRRLARHKGLSLYRADHLFFARNCLAAAKAIRLAANADAERARIAAALAGSGWATPVGKQIGAEIARAA